MSSLFSLPVPWRESSAVQAGEIDGTLGDILAVAALNNAGTPTQIVSLGLGETGQEGRFAILASPGSDIKTPEQLKKRTCGHLNKFHYRICNR